MFSVKRIFIPVLLLALTACSTNGGNAPLPFLPSPTPTPTATPLPPTETPVPAAARVNGEVITLEEFNAELARYKQSQTAQGQAIDEQKTKDTVINDLIAQVLLAQGAREAGYAVDDATLQARIDALTQQLGGAEALTAWQQSHGYTDQSFRLSLRRAIAAAWMRDKIASEVPTIAEQIHVKQILTYNEGDAKEVSDQLAAGQTFEKVAALYDPITRGDIGWFPRGYLQLKAVEDAAFALPVDAVSQVFQTEIGFHYVKVVERQQDRPLSHEVLKTMQANAVVNWINARKQASEIILFP